jgi:hypothetical protein
MTALSVLHSCRYDCAIRPTQLSIWLHCPSYTVVDMTALSGLHSCRYDCAIRLTQLSIWLRYPAYTVVDMTALSGLHSCRYDCTVRPTQLSIIKTNRNACVRIIASNVHCVSSILIVMIVRQQNVGVCKGLCYTRRFIRTQSVLKCCVLKPQDSVQCPR